LNSNLIINRRWLQEAIQHTELELMMLHNLQTDISRLYAVLPDGSSVTDILSVADRLEQSLRITMNALQKLEDTLDRNNVKTSVKYEEAGRLATHVFD